MPSEPSTGPVLVVDDDASLRELVTALLHRSGYTAHEIATGEEALEAARLERPLLVVLDVKLPGTSGYEVCRMLRDEFGNGLPILFLSGERTEPLDRVAGLLLGADDYMVKPFDPDELMARVRALLRRSAPSENGALTPRETQVLGLLARGLRQKQIARELSISARTVGTHVEHILRKLDVHSRAEAVAVAYRERLVSGL